MSWMLTMAHRRAVDRVRASQSSRDRDSKVGIRDFDREYDQVAEHVEITLEGERVKRALQGLTELQRQAVELAYYGGLSHSEIAAELHVPVGTIKTTNPRRHDPSPRRTGGDVMTNRDDAHLLSGAYALDAVDAEEAALVEAAMHESEDLRSEVVGLSDTAVALGDGAAAADASARPPRPAARRDRVDAAARGRGPSDSEPAARPRCRSATTWCVAVVDAVRPMALLAVAAAAVVLFGGGFFVQRTLLEPAARVQRPSSLAADHHSDDRHDRRRRHRDRVLVEVRAPHRGRQLTGVTAPSGKVLQLWSMRGGAVTSAGLYDNGEQYALITGTPSAGESLAVTVEPDGGSAQPTTQPIVGSSSTPDPADEHDSRHDSDVQQEESAILPAEAPDSCSRAPGERAGISRSGRRRSPRWPSRTASRTSSRCRRTR